MLSVYDLARHKVLWQKTFNFPMSVLTRSFQVSPNGEVFAFINSRRPSIIIYDRQTGQVLKIALPANYGTA